MEGKEDKTTTELPSAQQHKMPTSCSLTGETRIQPDGEGPLVLPLPIGDGGMLTALSGRRPDSIASVARLCSSDSSSALEAIARGGETSETRAKHERNTEEMHVWNGNQHGSAVGRGFVDANLGGLIVHAIGFSAGVLHILGRWGSADENGITTRQQRLFSTNSLRCRWRSALEYSRCGRKGCLRGPLVEAADAGAGDSRSGDAAGRSTPSSVELSSARWAVPALRSEARMFLLILA